MVMRSVTDEQLFLCELHQLAAGADKQSAIDQCGGGQHRFTNVVGLNDFTLFGGEPHHKTFAVLIDAVEFVASENGRRPKLAAQALLPEQITRFRVATSEHAGAVDDIELVAMHHRAGTAGAEPIRLPGHSRRGGILARVERRFFFVEADALLILLGYFAGMWFLYAKGIGV